MKLDFGEDGYSVCKGQTNKYWQIFSEEKEKLGAYFFKTEKCKHNIDKLIKAVRETNPKYDLANNNCKHFTKHIWDKMNFP